MKRTILCFVALFLAFIVQAFSQADKPVVAVFALQPLNPITEGEAVQITQFVQEALFYSGRYEIVERAQIDKIVKEQRYQQSGLCDDACAVAIGKQLAAAKIIVGTVGRLGAAYTIQIRMLNVESGKMENSSSIVPKCALEDLPGYIPELVNKLFRGGEKTLTAPKVVSLENQKAGIAKPMAAKKAPDHELDIISDQYYVDKQPARLLEMIDRICFLELGSRSFYEIKLLILDKGIFSADGESGISWHDIGNIELSTFWESENKNVWILVISNRSYQTKLSFRICSANEDLIRNLKDKLESMWNLYKNN